MDRDKIIREFLAEAGRKGGLASQRRRNHANLDGNGAFNH